MKIKIKAIATCIALLPFLLISCDIIEQPYTEKPVKPVDTNKYVRKVLIEEYTGFRCGNCPSAAETATALHELYGDKVLIMRVHAGSYANPKGTHTYDFRTPEGTELDAFFGNSNAGNPNGMISRNGYPSTHILRDGEWESRINQLQALKPKMTIELQAAYNAATKKISGSYKVKFLQDGSVNDNIALFILEDSIIQYQTDYRLDPPDIYNYNHMHIFRDAINGLWGEPLSATAPKTDDVFEKSFEYVLPDSTDWKPKNLVIQGFVHDNGGTYEIWQVEQTKVR